MITHRAYPLDPDKTKIVSDHGKIMELNCSYLVYLSGVAAYENGRLIQDAFPTLDDDEREFLISGLLPEEFEALCYAGEMAEDEDEDLG